jgi:hypothetical protein
MFGKDYFKTREGKLIELPGDITASEAAQMEADALAAEKQLGKGPPPQPVPDVKKLDKKEDKKTKLAHAKGKKPGKGKGKRAPGAAAAAAMLKAAGTSKVAQYLASKAAPVVAKGFGKLNQLRENQQTHDSADEKRAQSEQAVLIPDSEGQSKSNAGQVNVVSGRPAPQVDPGKGKRTLQETLKANVPRKVEDVDNFKRDKKAQHTGAEVLKVVQVDKSSVVSTFQDMRSTPAPAPREFEPEPLPPPEAAPGTAALALGKDGIAPLQKEHTDLSKYTSEADSKLKEEGVTQEQLDMVDSGDLASANKEKKGMEKSAQTEPAAVQKFAQEQNKKVETDLKQEETKRRSEMGSRRKANLGVTGQKQKNTKSALEKKREEVATKINGIYTAAQDKVKKKLADLEIASMKRFDDGNNRATQQFEDDVNSELRAFKADRYSGWFGWARKVRDWWKGMDDLPAVKQIFERNREKFVATINKLVEDITADNKKVIQECKDELQNARTQIKDYVDKLGPSLKDIGKKAAEEMNSKLNEMDKFIAKKEEDLQNQLKDKQTAAIKAIDEKIEKMKEAMAGALAKLGKLLLWAAKKFFTWALEKFGFSLSDIENIINKGVAVLKAIFTKPIAFVKNLMSAAITGFKNFGKNFLKHLQDAVFDWLSGSIEGFKLPTTWDFKGILSIALQLIGITYANIRRHMVTVMTEPVVAGLEKTFMLVKTLITEGPMAAWEQLKEMASDIKEAFIQAVKDFIKQKIVEQAIQWIAGIFIPGAGIIKAIIGIYDTIVFFIKKAKDIIKMVGNFLSSVSEIAAGNIGAAAEAMEQGLARGLLLVVNFLAALLRLGGVTAKVRAAIQSVRTKVDDVLLKVAKWIATKAKALVSKIAGAGKDRSPESDAIKARIKRELSGKSIQSAEDANQLITKVYQSYLPQGLKGIKAQYDPLRPTEMIIKASASVTDEVARLPVNATGAREALDYVYRFRMDRGTTVLYVFFDTNEERFGDAYITNQPEEPGDIHAEDVFARDYLQPLRAEIQARRAAGALVTPADEKVKVALELNRLPCPRCSSLMQRLASENPDLKFVVRASSVSRIGTIQKTVQSDSELHIGFIEDMIRANIQVEPLEIFEAVRQHLLSLFTGLRNRTIRLRGDTLFEQIGSARGLMDHNIAETKKVIKLITAAKARAKLKKVPPKGTV